MEESKWVKTEISCDLHKKLKSYCVGREMSMQNFLMLSILDQVDKIEKESGDVHGDIVRDKS